MPNSSSTTNRTKSDKPRFADRVMRTTLPNGARLLVLENHATPTVALRGSLLAGSYFEPHDKPGLASITADMLERGTRRHSKLEIADRLESVGADVNLSASMFAVSITGRALSGDLPMVIETIIEELREPSFPADELEKLKQQTAASIQEQQQSTRYRAYERFTQLIFDPRNPFYIPSGERLIESINSITVEDVRGFYEKQYGGRSLVLSVVGDVNSERVKGQFAEAVSEFAGPASVEVNVADVQLQKGLRREAVVLKDKANLDVLLGSASPLLRRSPDYYAAMLANSALGESTLSSRLGLEVRDREGLTYGIGSRFRAPGLAAGPWYIVVSVSPHNLERAINSGLRVLRDYVEHGIKPDELKDQQSSAVGSFKVSLSTNAGIAEALWNTEFYDLGLDYVDRYPALVQAVTVEEANQAIRKYFRPDDLTIVVAGDNDGAPPTL